MATEKARRRVATETGLYVLVLAAIAIVVNVLGAGASKRWDVTKNERYTLSQGSGRLVQSLNEPMLVDAYVTRGLAKLEVYVDDLTSLLKEYERSSEGKFSFTLIEAKTADLKERAKEAGLQPLTFAAQAETGEDQAAIAQGYLGLVFKYGSEKGVLQLMPGDAQGLEFVISNKIREIRDKADERKPKIGVVTGKDELKLDDTNLVPRRGQGGANIKAIMSQHFPFYELVDVELNESAPIDKDLVGLIITQPQKDYTDKELRRIDEFLMLGDKSLAVFASAVNIKPNDAKMEAELNTHGLEKLLAGYGINMKKDVLLDYGAHLQAPILTQAGIAQVRHPPIAHVTEDPRLEGDEQLLDTGFPSFFRLQEAAFPYPSSLELLRDKQPDDVELKAIARTTPNTTELTDDKVDLSFRVDGWQPKQPFEQHVLAATADGNLKSAFAGSEDNMGIEVPERSEQPSRVLVISSSQFLTNPFAWAGNGPELGGQFAMFGNVGGDPQLLAIAGPYAQRYLTNMLLVVKNTLDWISGDSDLLATSAKIIGEPNLKYSSIKPKTIPVDATDQDLQAIEDEYKNARKSLQKKIEWTLILVVPAFFAAFGLIRWRMRLAKRTDLKLA
jgi:ABC-type uncharacterized transport system involved in gliding motility auxiliary subunit